MGYQYFDVLVSSDCLEGLMAGALFAKAGARVAVLDNYVPFIEKGSYRFDADPAPITCAGSNGVFGRIVNNLNLSYEEQRRFYPIDPPLQILTPTMRLAIPLGLKELKKELNRECPQNVNELLQLRSDLSEWAKGYSLSPLTTVPWWKKWRAPSSEKEEGRPNIEGLSSKESLLQFLTPMAQSYASYAVHHLSLSEKLYLAFGYLNETYHYKGGKTGLRDLFRSQLKFYGGQYFEKTRIEKVYVEKREARAMELNKGEQMIRFRYALRLGKGLDFFKLFPESFRLRRWLKKSLSSSPSTRLYRLFIGIRDEGIPVGLGRRALFMPDSQRYLLLTLNPENRAPSEAKGTKVLTVEMYEPIGNGGTSDWTPQKEKEILSLLKQLMPFLERHIDFYLPGHSERLSPPLTPWSPQPAKKIGKTPIRNTYYLGPEWGNGLSFEDHLKRLIQIVENITSNLLRGVT